MNDFRNTQSAPTARMPLMPIAFRDTALAVAQLADDAAPNKSGDFRKKCLALVESLKSELALAGHLPDVIRDATYAQCALLDETALSRLKGAERDNWESEPLQVREFKTNDAGDALIAIIRRRVAEPRPKVALLAMLSAVLGLGFKGQFAIQGADARIELMRALDQQIGQGVDRDTSGTVLAHAKHAADVECPDFAARLDRDRRRRGGAGVSRAVAMARFIDRADRCMTERVLAAHSAQSNLRSTAGIGLSGYPYRTLLGWIALLAIIWLVLCSPWSLGWNIGLGVVVLALTSMLCAGSALRSLKIERA